MASGRLLVLENEQNALEQKNKIWYNGLRFSIGLGENQVVMIGVRCRRSKLEDALLKVGKKNIKVGWRQRRLIKQKFCAAQQH